MAKGRRSNRSADTSDIANTDVLLREMLEPELPLLQEIQVPRERHVVSRVDEFLGEQLPFDRRLFSFGEPEVYSLSVPSVREAPRGGSLTHRVQFNDASTVAICYRRKARREVLHALRKTGGRKGRRRRSWRSDIKC